VSRSVGVARGKRVIDLGKMIYLRAKHVQHRRLDNKPRKRRELLSAYRSVENRGQAMPNFFVRLIAAIFLLYLFTFFLASRFQPTGTKIS
jgi:hypothetical protein